MLKCDCGVERLFIDRADKLREASEEKQAETKTRIQKTAGGGRGRCKYSIPLQMYPSEGRRLVK